MAAATYAIALGANRRGRHGSPAAEIRAALASIGDVIAASPIVETSPLGPSTRRYANAAAVIASAETPPELLARLKAIEADFGRRAGRRWGARVLDLDIVLWSGGSWADRDVTVPHPAFRERAFVLVPLAIIAPAWRDPLTGRSVRQLLRRLARPRATRAGAGP